MTAKAVNTIRRGRPRKPEATTNLNFRIENDVLAWVDANKGGISRNQFINNIIRKEAQL